MANSNSFKMAQKTAFEATSSPGLFPQTLFPPYPFFEGKALGTRLLLRQKDDYIQQVR